MKTKTLLIITVFLIHAVALVASSDAQRITENTYEDKFPAIRNHALVWQGQVDGNWEIFYYNTQTDDLLRLTNNDDDDMSPQTDGNYVTWVAYGSSGGDIFVYDISTDTTKRISGDPESGYIHNAPKIASGRITWEFDQAGDSVEFGDIYLYETRYMSLTCISSLVDPNNQLDDSSPRIDSQYVMWTQTGPTGTTRFLYDLATGETPAPAPEGFVWSDDPRIDGTLSVFTWHDGNDREVFVRDSVLDFDEQVTKNAVEDRSPCISGTEVAWVQGTHADSEIHLSRGPGRCLSVDVDQDGDVDGSDLAQMLVFPNPSLFSPFAEKFGMAECRL